MQNNGNFVLFEINFFKNHLMKILVTFLVFYEMLVFDLITEAYSELSQSSKIELFAKIAKGFQRLTVLPKSSILYVWVLNAPPDYKYCTLLCPLLQVFVKIFLVGNKAKGRISKRVF